MRGIALYGRTYLDAEVEVPLELLATGKGKVDVEVTAKLGGFPCNAARALAGRFAAGDLHVVTRISPLDLPRLRAALAAGVHIHAVATATDEEWPPLAVIVNPARECRLLRSGRAGDLGAAEVKEVPPAALHVFGRIDPGVVAHVRGAVSEAVLAWCGGASADAEIVHMCDLACVNTAEARTLLAAPDASTRELAVALAERAPARGVRIVTGRGDAPAVAAVRGASGVQCHEAAPAPIARDQVRTLKGVGDVFAAHFFAEVALDERGVRRAELAVERALLAAHAAAAAFMTGANA